MKIQKNGIGSHHSANSGKDEWLTPPEFQIKLGDFDLDPCSPITRPWDTASVHYTIEDNGLAQRWFGRVWCNPPYGKETGHWLARCAEHGNATALIFARTETAAWVNNVWGKAHAVMFIFGRLSFHHVDGKVATRNAGAPSALVSYDKWNTMALESSGIAGRIVRL